MSHIFCARVYMWTRRGGQVISTMSKIGHVNKGYAVCEIPKIVHSRGLVGQVGTGMGTKFCLRNCRMSPMASIPESTLIPWLRFQKSALHNGKPCTQTPYGWLFHTALPFKTPAVSKPNQMLATKYVLRMYQYGLSSYTQAGMR